MANEYRIQQKAEIFYEVVVEAETLEEALSLADESGDWEQLTETMLLVDEYWYNENDTEWKEVK